MQNHFYHLKTKTMAVHPLLKGAGIFLWLIIPGSSILLIPFLLKKIKKDRNDYQQKIKSYTYLKEISKHDLCPGEAFIVKDIFLGRPVCVTYNDYHNVKKKDYLFILKDGPSHLQKNQTYQFNDMNDTIVSVTGL
jgi:hypothetical protein